jgi:hypothetical protein
MPEPAPPLSVSDVLGAAGTFPAVRWRGREYPVSPPTLGTVARLEVLIAAAAGAEVDALQGTPLHARMSKALEAMLVARAHRAGGELWDRYMGGTDGAVLYLLALLREKSPDMTEADARRMAAEESDQVRRALVLVTPDFLRLVGERAGASPDQVAAALRRLPTG